MAPKPMRSWLALWTIYGVEIDIHKLAYVEYFDAVAEVLEARRMHVGPRVTHGVGPQRY